MLSCRAFGLVSVALVAFLVSGTSIAKPPSRADWGEVPLHFEPNQGQADTRWEFLTRGPGYSLLLGGEEILMHLHRRRLRDDAVAPYDTRGAEIEQALIGLRLLDTAEPEPMRASEPMPGRVNYYIGQDPAGWLENVPTFGRVEANGVYSGIDLVVYGNAGRVEFDFVVAPEVDPSAIALGVEGGESLRLTPEGALEIASAVGPLQLAKPIAYQEGERRREIVDVAYKLDESGHVRFRLGEYDTSRPLVIDPVLVYSTFVGGSSTEYAGDIVVDGSGNAIIVGQTRSASDFPLDGAAQSVCGSSPTLITGGCGDAFITKLNAAGTGLVYSTFLGGGENAFSSTPGFEEAWGVDVDPSGNAYVTGMTNSFDFPATTGAYQEFCRALPIPVGTFPGGYCPPEVFVAKLSSTGALTWATYVGGTNLDIGLDIAVNSLGNAYVTGLTQSATDPGVTGSMGFPITIINAWFPTCRGGTTAEIWDQDCHDAFYLKLSQDGSSLVQSSYLGGSRDDVGYGIVVNSGGDAVLVGSTESTDFLATAGSLNTSCNGPAMFSPCQDGWVTRIQQVSSAQCTPVAGDGCGGSPGNSGSFSTYLGGIDASALDVDLDAAEAVYVTGTAAGTYPTTPGAYDTTRNNTDAFVTKLTAAGDALVYSTFVGGIGKDQGFGIAVDFEGRAYIAGRTEPRLNLQTFLYENDFPVLDAFQSSCGSDSGGCTNDFFVTKLTPDGSALDYSSYLGGNGLDGLEPPGDGISGGIDVDATGNAYVLGTTFSSNFPTTVGAWDRTLGSFDAFVTKVESTTCFPETEVCDGIDNDCDGVVDNDVDDIVTGSDIGECRVEIQSCVDGSFQVTQTGIGPTSETCDGLDNDCEGTIDNGVPDMVSGSDVGECQEEIQSCVGGTFQITQPGIGPATEICDGLDNDCNGQDDGTQGICNSPPSPDPVEFTDPSGSASLEFPDIETGGDTTVAEVTCDLDLPSGFTLNTEARCYDIQSTAMSSTGEMIVCLRFPDSLDPAPTHMMKCEDPGNPLSCCYVRLDGGGTTCLPDATPPGPQFLSLGPAPAPPPDEREICVTTTTLSGWTIAVQDAAFDSDFDTVPDLTDNCPFDFNVSQADDDMDGSGNACDNCQASPNGSLGGTCTAGDPLVLGMGCTLNGDCGTGGLCSRFQEDFDGDDVGDACDPSLVPFYTADVFETPECFSQGGCSPADFPVDWGVLRTFEYGIPAGTTVVDVLIEGTWGNGTFGGTAPVELFLEGIPFAECVAPDPCWQNASTVDWNGGAGFRLRDDLGVSFANPAVRSLFEDGTAEFSVVQNDEISANLSNLKLTVFLPEPGGALPAAVGGLALLLAARRRSRTS